MTTPSTNPSEATPAPLMFNPFDPGFRKDPYSVYRRMRTEAPVYRNPLGGWILSRHADCIAMLRDPRSSNDARNSLEFQALADQRPDLADLDDSAGQSFLFLDPPDHTRLRGLVSKAFTPRVIERLRPRIQEIVDDLLDQVDGKGEMELIEDLAYPLPVQVISEMLGVPGEDHAVFKGWSRDLARALDPTPALDEAEMARTIAAREAFTDYFRRLIEKRRAAPGNDLLSALVAVEEQGDTLTEAELLSTCILLLIAGHETTVNLIGNGLLALLRNPDQLALLRDNPSLEKGAVEELLRYDAPVQMTSRILLADYEIDGQTIAKGEQATLLLASANRDPTEFEDPERLDLTREENRHLAFGFGIHFCLGAPLARVEGQIALATLVRRFPQLELLTGDPEYKENIVLRGLAALPVGISGR